MYLHSLLFIVLVLSNCGILGNDPKEPKLEPGPRNYIWEVDTLYNGPSGWIDDMWGSSPDNVYAVTGGGLETLWHYDGEEWQPWPERVGPALYNIYGVAEDDVWMGGNDGKIYHFDGTDWSLFYTYSPTGLSNARITDISGTSPDNVYAVGIIVPNEIDGWVSFILHFDGSNWREILATDFEVQFQRIHVHKNLPIIKAVKRTDDGDDILLIYRYNDKELEEVKSGTKSELRAISMNEIDEDIYSYTGTTISKLERDSFVEFLNFPEVEEIVRVDGRHEKDLFIHTWIATYHYNGENLKSLIEGLPRNVYRAQLFDNEVFFTIPDFANGINLMYRGTLIEEEE